MCESTNINEFQRVFSIIVLPTGGFTIPPYTNRPTFITYTLEIEIFILFLCYSLPYLIARSSRESPQRFESSPNSIYELSTYPLQT